MKEFKYQKILTVLVIVPQKDHSIFASRTQFIGIIGQLRNSCKWNKTE